MLQNISNLVATRPHEAQSLYLPIRQTQSETGVTALDHITSAPELAPIALHRSSFQAQRSRHPHFRQEIGQRGSPLLIENTL